MEVKEVEEELRKWKQALAKLQVKSELAAESLVSCYSEELKGVDPASNKGCAILSTITGQGFDKVQRVIQ